MDIFKWDQDWLTYTNGTDIGIIGGGELHPHKQKGLRRDTRAIMWIEGYGAGKGEGKCMLSVLIVFGLDHGWLMALNIMLIMMTMHIVMTLRHYKAR